MPVAPFHRWSTVFSAAALVAGAAAPRLAAQVSAGAHAVALLTRADPVPGGAALTEGRLVQTTLHGAASLLDGRLRLNAMLNLEGLTMPGGVLSAGGWGEGFVDRRHPHTYVHELMVSAVDVVRLPRLRWSVSAGRGFAPYGTDDPMSRPAVGFPVNHHWSQVLERAVVIGAVRVGPVTLEGGLFNGDEPEHPSQWPSWKRFGDSWSARVLLAPAPGIEAQVSRARIASPEHRLGAGLEHRLWSASVRADRATGAGRLTMLAEWADADEEGAFRFETVLVEAQLAARPGRAWARIERTTRPEETRLFGEPFRSLRPHHENSNLGITRWNVVSGGVARPAGPAAWPVRFEVLAEASRATVTRITGIFDPVMFYGRNDLWTVSVGVRIGAGAPAHRMGRYGLVAEAPGEPTDHDGHP